MLPYSGRLLVTACLLTLQPLLAQEKKALSLEDAVLKQSTELAPRGITGLEWLNPTTYFHKKGKGPSEVLIKFDLAKQRESELLSLSTLNEKLKGIGNELLELPEFKYSGENLLNFRIKSSWYLFNAGNGQIKSFENETDGISDAILAPGATSLAYVKDNNVFVKVPGSQARQITGDGSADIVNGKAASRSEFGISNGLFWSPSGNALAYYRVDMSAISAYPLVDLEKVPAVPAPLKYPMAGSQSEIVTLNVSYKDGKSVMLKTTATPEEDAYICSVNWSPDETSILLVTLNRGQDHMKFKRFNAVTGELIALEYEEKDSNYVEPLHPVIFTISDGSEFLFLSRKNGYMNPYLKSAGGIREFPSGKKELTRYIGADQNLKSFYFEGCGHRPVETDIYRLDLKAGEMRKISGNAGTYRASLSPGGKYMFTWFSNLSTPQRIVVADGEGLVVKQLHNAPDPLEEYALARPEIVTFDNGSGIELYGRIVKPHNFSEGNKYPVLVYVYNGPHVQLVKNSWWASASLWMSYMAEKGYIVFTVDGRGSEHRGKEFEQAIFRKLGEVEMADQIAGVNYLKSLPYIDGDKMAVHGWSYGGFMTINLMLKQPGVFKVGVAGGPVTNWKYYEVMYTERYMDTPEENPEGYKNSDLSNYVSGLKGKLLLIHGMSDDVVVPQHNLNLVKKFIDAGIEVDFFPYPGHGHNVRGKDRLHLMRKVLSYIDSTIKS